MDDARFKSYKETYYKMKPNTYLDKELKNKLVESYTDEVFSKKEEEDNFIKYGKIYNYIARVDLETNFYCNLYKNRLNSKFYEKFYICKNLKKDFEKTPWEDGFVDWRSSIGDLYYSQNLHITSNYGKDYTKSSNVMLKRSIDLEEKNFSNLYIIDNDLDLEKIEKKQLIKSMQKQRKKYKVTDIIDTIQPKQNHIVREDLNHSLIVQGCAGSGKTMILLHRLSYIIYMNRKNKEELIDTENIKLIIPSEEFEFSIDELSTDLELANIKKTSIFDYYVILLNRYVEEFSINKKTSGLDMEKILMEAPRKIYKDINSEIEIIYKNYMENYFESISFDYFNVILDENKIEKPNIRKSLGDKNQLEIYKLRLKKYLDFKRKNMIINEIEKIKFKIEKYENISRKNKMKLKLVNNFIEVLNNFNEEIKSYIDTIKEIMKKSYFKIDDINKRDINKAKLKTALITLNYSLANNYANLNLLLKKDNFLNEILDTSDKLLELEDKINIKELKLSELSEIEVTINYLLEYCLRNQNNIKKEQTIIEKNIQDMHQYINEENRMTDLSKKEEKEIKKVLDELEDNNYLIGDLFSTIIYNLDKNNINYSKVYVLLRIVILYYGPTKNRDKIVIFDEGQDYTYDTYQTIIQANSIEEGHGDFHMNIFGDLNQRLQEDTSISNWEELSDIKEFKVYKLTKNFRNTIENTNYCKEKLDIYAEGIGLKGKEVMEIDFSKRQIYFDKEVDECPERRFAIISDNENYVRFEGENRVNLKKLSPEEAKGLEFEVVFVYDAKLTRNEKYIAYTRSMDRLYILK